MAYTKLFSSIVTSTIWSESDRTRIVWITMLAICDKNGEVQGSIPGLARIAGVPVEDCRAAIATFLSPDLDSRTKDDEGRRIEGIDGGWILLNYAKYREMASHEDRQRSAAERQARVRDRKKRNAESRTSHAPVTPESRQICQAEAEAEAEKKNTCAEPPSAGLAPEGFDEFWELYPRKLDKKRAMASWKRIALKDHAAIMENIAGRIRSDESWSKDGGKYIPHPTTYLNGKRWEDQFQTRIEMVPAHKVWTPEEMLRAAIG